MKMITITTWKNFTQLHELLRFFAFAVTSLKFKNFQFNILNFKKCTISPFTLGLEVKSDDRGVK